MSIESQLNHVNEKLQLLLRQYQQVRKENEQLKQEITKQQELAMETGNKLAELHQQVAVLRFTTGEMDEKEKRAFENRINQYLREIDKCIAFLSQ